MPVLIHWDSVPMTARLLQKFFLILIFIIPHTVLYTQNEDPFKNVVNDDLSNETVGSGARFPPYHRLDLQISRHFYFSRSRISLFLSIINLYNRGNVRNIKYNWGTDQDGIPYLEEREEYWFRLLPSIGVNWRWNH